MMKMHKFGDKFEVVSGGDCYGLKGGDILTLHEEINSCGAWFKTELGKLIVGGYEGETTVSPTVRPIRTEAEKRGAKFGVGGVVKETSAVKHAIGKKILFVCVAQTVALEEVWLCVIEGETETTTFFPFCIRLDHEPEYKEIPFSEGTHEQRLDVGSLWYGDSPVVQISHFAGSGYAFTYTGSFDIHTDANNLKIRIPT